MGELGLWLSAVLALLVVLAPREARAALALDASIDIRVCVGLELVGLVER